MALKKKSKIFQYLHTREREEAILKSRHDFWPLFSVKCIFMRFVHKDVNLTHNEDAVRPSVHVLISETIQWILTKFLTINLSGVFN